MNITISSNGTMQLTHENITWSAYPGLNEKHLHPLSLEVQSAADGGGQVVYQLEQGKVTLKAEPDGQGGWKLNTTLEGLSGKCHWFHPLFDIDMLETTGAYRLGFGFGGPSGYLNPQQIKELKEPFHSFGMFGAQYGNGYVMISSDRHDAYLNRYDIVASNREDAGLLLSAGFRVEHKQEDRIELPTLYLTFSSTLEAGLEEATARIAETMGARTHREPAYHWCSWYAEYHNFSQTHLEEFMPAFKELEIPLEFIQIDAGYCESSGDWLEPNAEWPLGLEGAFRTIKENGFKPAIWVGPYMVGNRSRIFKEHPDWLLRFNDGKLLTPWRYYDEWKMMGKPDEEYYVLDTSHPEAMDYVRTVFRTMKAWGAEMYKTDFIFWGVEDSTKVKRHTPGKTSIEYVTDMLHIIREEIGEESYWLACIAPFMPFVGLADGMRTAYDVGATWNPVGTGNLIREVPASNHMNHVLWQNDPDVMMLREYYMNLKPNEIEALALFQAVSGGAIVGSDALHRIAQERRDLFAFVRPMSKRTPSTPYLDRPRKHIVFTHEDQVTGRGMLYFFNAGDEAVTELYDLKELLGSDKASWWCWNNNERSEESVKELAVPLPPHSCRLYYTSTAGEMFPDKVTNIWEWIEHKEINS
ncbi:hypothetical protein SY83_22450 [Paenibacillus swuensis]|uniref:Alpha-galactosidase n=1 Tax=Paenibacillus swuensis TaxID=1178515 RepID=A0A172TNJ5_9BACL|nr:glycoside hydrolase family 36 protein [Paenibacillus swuensis]ANE48590.1 hypothetical protein SY83_22450 [Paenibacillus swuensis]